MPCLLPTSRHPSRRQLSWPLLVSQFLWECPFIVGAWTEHAGFNDQEAGWLAALDSTGGIAASMVVSRVIRYANWRLIAVSGIALAVVANVISMSATSFGPLSVCRALAGLGSGTIYSLGLAALSTTYRAGRNFSILLFVQVSWGMLEINIFSHLIKSGGMEAIYTVMASAFFLSLLFVRWLPTSAQSTGTLSAKGTPTNTRVHREDAWLCLTAVFLFYLAASSLWAYIERIGDFAGLSNHFITQSLTYTQVLSLLGCILAGWLSVRLGQWRPLLVSLLCVTLAILSLSWGFNALKFVLVISVFFLLWNAIDIYQLGTLANLDHSGRSAALVPAFQMTAGALGPAIAAWLLGWHGSYSAVSLMAAGCTLTALLIYCYAYITTGDYGH